MSILITPMVEKLASTNNSVRWELAKLTVNFQRGRRIPNDCKHLRYWIGNDGDMRIYADKEANEKMRVYDTMRWDI